MGKTVYIHGIMRINNNRLLLFIIKLNMEIFKVLYLYFIHHLCWSVLSNIYKIRYSPFTKMNGLMVNCYISYFSIIRIINIYSPIYIYCNTKPFSKNSRGVRVYEYKGLCLINQIGGFVWAFSKSFFYNCYK